MTTKTIPYRFRLSTGRTADSDLYDKILREGTLDRDLARALRAYALGENLGCTPDFYALIEAETARGVERRFDIRRGAQALAVAEDVEAHGALRTYYDRNLAAGDSLDSTGAIR